MLEISRENELNEASSETGRTVGQEAGTVCLLVTTNVYADPPSSVASAQSGKHTVRIPNQFMRSLHEFAEFLASQGSDSRQRLLSLATNFDSMGPTSREAAAQVLDFVMTILSPLSEAFPPNKRRERVSLD